MKKYQRIMMCVAVGAYLLQFGGCVAGLLADTIFGLAPLLLSEGARGASGSGLGDWLCLRPTAGHRRG